jgi:HPt (histidine-containing phosphotransfer) domain-containing protein
MKKKEENLSEPVWNQAELLDRVDHDQELLRELLTIFRTDFPRTIHSLEAAVAGGDLKNSASLSHALKGMLSNLGGGARRRPQRGSKRALPPEIKPR